MSTRSPVTTEKSGFRALMASTAALSRESEWTKPSDRSPQPIWVFVQWTKVKGVNYPEQETRVRAAIAEMARI